MVLVSDLRSTKSTLITNVGGTEAELLFEQFGE